MIKKKIMDAFNEQLTKELYSSNLYLAMAGYFKWINLPGFANWMLIQAKEENIHAMLFFNYILDRGGEVRIGAFDALPSKWNSPMAAFEATKKHEEFVTASINKLMGISLQENDYAANIFLQWFVNEQVEEEANVNEILERLKMLGDFKGGLLMMDAELKARVFTPPANTQVTGTIA